MPDLKNVRLMGHSKRNCKFCGIEYQYFGEPEGDTGFCCRLHELEYTKKPEVREFEKSISLD
jgi:hypothetical protein